MTLSLRVKAALAFLLLAALTLLSLAGCTGIAGSSGAGSSSNGTGSHPGATLPPSNGATVPAAPSSLQATAGNAQVALSWGATTGANSYPIKRSTTSGGPHTQIAAPTATNFIDTGLTNGTTYLYVVSALNANGESPNSAQASATPTATPPPPPLPAPPSSADVTITIDPTKTKPISPYIYGLNFYFGNTSAPPLLTWDREGGNRWTAYNWETNASNAGSDYLYENDSYNRSTSSQVTAITGQPLSGTAHLYQMTAASAQPQFAAGNPVEPVSAGTMPVSGNSLTITLPALSVTSIDIH
jgi:hypothetical protein